MQEMQETQVRFLGREDPLEKKMATHYSILAWEIPQPEKPGSIQFMGWQRVGRNEQLTLQFIHGAIFVRFIDQY